MFDSSGLDRTYQEHMVVATQLPRIAILDFLSCLFREPQNRFPLLLKMLPDAHPMAKIETPRPIRGTQDMLGDSADRFAHVVETFERVRKLYGFKRIEVPVFEATAALPRARLARLRTSSPRRCTASRIAAGDSLTLRRSYRRHSPAPISPRAGSNMRRAQGCDARAPVSLRASAKGPLPPVPPARRRDHRRGRAAGRRRTADLRRPAAQGARHRRGRDPDAQHARRHARPARRGGRHWWRISRPIAAI